MKMLSSCQGNEAKFIVRSLEGKLRIGLAGRTLVVALAHAIVLKEIGTYSGYLAGKEDTDETGDKKMSPEKLAKLLEDGAEKVKSVYRYAIPSLVRKQNAESAVNCQIMI